MQNAYHLKLRNLPSQDLLRGYTSSTSQEREILSILGYRWKQINLSKV